MITVEWLKSLYASGLSMCWLWDEQTQQYYFQVPINGREIRWFSGSECLQLAQSHQFGIDVVKISDRGTQEQFNILLSLLRLS